MSKVNLFLEVINGNNRRVNDIPTAARNSYPEESPTLGLEKITLKHDFQQVKDSDLMLNLVYWK